MGLYYSFNTIRYYIFINTINLTRHQLLFMQILDVWLKKDGCNSSLKSSTTNVGEQMPCSYFMSTIWAFDCMKTKHDAFRGNDCKKNFANP